MAHRSLISKIFCLCCKAWEEPDATDASKATSKTQEHKQPTSRVWSLEKLDKQTTKLSKSPSPSKQLAIHPEKKDNYSISSDFMDNVSPRGFYKRNLNRYSQQHWPYQQCRIGKP